MGNIQPGIMEEPPAQARYMSFLLTPDSDYRQGLMNLQKLADGKHCVVGLGKSLVSALNADIENLHSFPVLTGKGIEIPSTPIALWCWLRGDDRGELLHLGRAVEQALGDSFQIARIVDGFKYQEGRDLSGYVDGTENPTGEDANNVAIVSDESDGLNGSSFVAVQEWVHDLDYFDSLSTEARDDIIGRRIADNEEIDDAPASAHVKRTAQESFSPEAFVLRRSMPWVDESAQGLMFVSFGQNFNAFEALLKHMVGEDDGIMDAIFEFSRAVSGSYFWCPPMKKDQLDLTRLGIF